MRELILIFTKYLITKQKLHEHNNTVQYYKKDSKWRPPHLMQALHRRTKLWYTLSNTIGISRTTSDAASILTTSVSRWSRWGWYLVKESFDMSLTEVIKRRRSSSQTCTDSGLLRKTWVLIRKLLYSDSYSFLFVSNLLNHPVYYYIILIPCLSFFLIRYFQRNILP